MRYTNRGDRDFYRAQRALEMSSVEDETEMEEEALRPLYRVL